MDGVTIIIDLRECPMMVTAALSSLIGRWDFGWNSNGTLVVHLIHWFFPPIEFPCRLSWNEPIFIPKTAAGSRYLALFVKTSLFILMAIFPSGKNIHMWFILNGNGLFWQPHLFYSRRPWSAKKAPRVKKSLCLVRHPAPPARWLGGRAQLCSATGRNTA